MPRRRALLTDAGTIEAIVQIVVLGTDKALVIGAPGDEVRLAALLRKRIGASVRAHVVDMTSAYAVFDLVGLRAAATLTTVGHRPRHGQDGDRVHDLGLGMGWIVDGGEHGLSCQRLIVPAEMAQHMYERITSAGARPVGAFALRALVIEACLPRWG